MKETKEKKEEINWLKYYQYFCKYNHVHLNGQSSWQTFYYIQWLNGIRLGLAVIIVLITVIIGSVGALLGALKWFLALFIIDFVVNWVISLVNKTESLSTEGVRGLPPEHRQMLVHEKDGQMYQYKTPMQSYKAYLKRPKEDINDSPGKPL